MGLKIHIYGINDRAAILPEWIDEIPKTHFQLQEIPTNIEKNESLSRLLNNRSADYFKTQDLFVETVNNYLKKELGVYVNDMILEVAYATKEKYDLCYSIGCLNHFNYTNPELENIVRFNRSVQITKNVLSVLRDYDNILKDRQVSDTLKYDNIDFVKLEQEYRQGKKMKVINGLIQDFLLYSGDLGDIKPKIAMEALEETLPITYSVEKNKVYVNPGTFRKVFSKAKKEFNLDEIVVLVGEPHRIFLEYFLKKEFGDVSSTPKTLDFLETNNETKWVKDEISLAEKEKFI